VARQGEEAMSAALRLRLLPALLAVGLMECWFVHRDVAASAAAAPGSAAAAALAFIAAPATLGALAAVWAVLAWSGAVWAYGVAAAAGAFANWTLLAVDRGAIDHSAMMPEALCLLLFLALLARRGRPGAAEQAWELGCVLIGAMYFNTGLAKLLDTGLGWAAGETARALVASEAHGGGALAGLRMAFASSPAAGWCAAAGTLLIELLAAPAFALRRWRFPAGLCLFGMHASIFVLAAIPWAYFGLLILALSLPEASPARAGVRPARAVKPA
jgi:hypothetical protein